MDAGPDSGVATAVAGNKTTEGTETKRISAPSAFLVVPSGFACHRKV